VAQILAHAGMAFGSRENLLALDAAAYRRLSTPNQPPNYLLADLCLVLAFA